MTADSPLALLALVPPRGVCCERLRALHGCGVRLSGATQERNERPEPPMRLQDSKSLT